VALIEDGRVVLGVVAAPALNLSYHAELGKGAFRLGDTGSERIQYSSHRTHLICADSRFHSSDETNVFCERNGIVEILRSGSAIKMCKLAEGLVDVYPRFGTTMEWDVAASQIIAEEAGCEVVDVSTKLPLRYNKEDMRVPGFVAFPRGRAFEW
jgi:3'(2'), 5'-bisphosphate nucleotidase